jgi:hypothetical protein
LLARRYRGPYRGPDAGPKYAAEVKEIQALTGGVGTFIHESIMGTPAAPALPNDLLLACSPALRSFFVLASLRPP